MINYKKNFLILFLILTIFFTLFIVIPRNQTNPSSQNDSQYQEIYSKLSDESIIKAELDGIEIELEVAKSNSKKTNGLMFVEEMEENNGMIFVYPNENYRDFWMKNTLISLDIIYINKDFNVIQIYKNTKTEQTDETYPSNEPAQYVVELKGGWSDENSLEVGNRFEITEFISQ